MRDDYDGKRTASVEYGTIGDDERRTILLETEGRIENVQVKETRGKHIEVKLRIPYQNEVFQALGAMATEYTDVDFKYVQAPVEKTPEEIDEEKQGKMEFEEVG
jgi:F0F1-type ATP synthase beta subunit